MRQATALGVILSLTAAAKLWAQVLLTREQAVREIFPGQARVTSDTRALPLMVKADLEKTLGRRIREDSVTTLVIHDSAGVLLGYAVVTDEIGKYEPITFMVGITPAFAVRDVAIMVYRESRGGDVKRKRFLTQYRGKKANDPISIDRDIINVSGATLSARAVSAGVKRALAEVAAIYAGEK